MPVLNHEAVVGGLARAYDVHGIEVPDMHIIIIKQLKGGGKASYDRCKNDTSHRDRPERPGDDAARGAPPTE